MRWWIKELPDFYAEGGVWHYLDSGEWHYLDNGVNYLLGIGDPLHYWHYNTYSIIDGIAGVRRFDHTETILIQMMSYGCDEPYICYGDGTVVCPGIVTIYHSNAS